MNDRPPQAIRIVALFPHEDAARPLRIYQGRLFAAGFLGARAFPLCAPLAVLSRPLRRAELEGIAEEARTGAAHADERGRIFLDTSTPFAADVPLLPPYLGLPVSVSSPRTLPADATLSICRPALLISLLEAEDKSLSALPPIGEDGAPASFRAAYVANVSVISAGIGNDRFSFVWEIGRPRWLPGRGR